MAELQDPTVNRTYKLPRGLIARLNREARALCVYPSELVRFFLTRGLDQVAAGELVIPTRPAHRCIIFSEDQEV
ncbi:MAG: hypothetical protein WC443_08725 [Desulfobaccales bacterium]